MTAWDYPILFVLALVAGFWVAGWLLRHGNVLRQPDFVCDVCGRKQRGLSPREWRYCPYCGTPRPRREEI